MDKRSPVYTEKTECRDCHRCLRVCPVKAIRIESGSAFVTPERCISCASCVSACPGGAKRIRSDLARVRDAISAGDAPIVSLAPSFAGEFPGWSEGAFAAALRSLGFAGVSETALGAEMVSSAVSEIFSGMSESVLISSACPVIVEMIGKYYPQFSHMVSDLCSPLLAHARLLKKEYGANAKIVFIGPCAAKKSEADMNPDLLLAALTFENLRKWMEEAGIQADDFKSHADEGAFIGARAAKGRLYPVDGGMISGIRDACPACDAEMLAISGIDAVRRALDDLEISGLQGKLFLELLACPGGCVNGPGAAARVSTLVKRASVISSAASVSASDQRMIPPVSVQMSRRMPPFEFQKHDPAEIRLVLESVGKQSLRDELNCDGCGHGDCKSFAAAVLEGRAERDMCVSYMRLLALKKANSLIKTIPSGVVIVDRELKILESNRRFAEIIGDSSLSVYESRNGFDGIPIDQITPLLSPLLSYVLSSGVEIPSKILRDSESSFRVSVFIIEPGKVAGAVINSVSEALLCGEELIRQANELIRKNLKTTQKIAYLLGENASETQSSLSSIVQILSGIKDSSGEKRG